MADPGYVLLVENTPLPVLIQLDEQTPAALIAWAHAREKTPSTCTRTNDFAAKVRREAAVLEAASRTVVAAMFTAGLE